MANWWGSRTCLSHMPDHRPKLITEIHPRTSVISCSYFIAVLYLVLLSQDYSREILISFIANKEFQNSKCLFSPINSLQICYLEDYVSVSKVCLSFKTGKGIPIHTTRGKIWNIHLWSKSAIPAFQTCFKERSLACIADHGFHDSFLLHHLLRCPAWGRPIGVES